MVFENPIFNSVFLLFSYALLGGGVKYIDQAHDASVYSKRVALILAVLCGTLMSLLIATDSYSAILLIAIVFGVVFTKKVDNYSFLIGTIIVMLFPFVYWINAGFPIIDVSALVFLSITGIIDELGNDAYDRKKMRGWLGKFFAYRCMMKVGALLLFAVSRLPLVYFFAFVCFDIGYTLVDIHANNREKAAKLHA